ncbi:uncharacterized protein LOC103468960 [Poecilia reticulata]|uniref:uncharacterized protein LOC103468960 n=1 Tax=Poecilia reticulata TaxID=8081 RepID=UPI0004A4F181|nr:PREDICTED: uncharacterized protein LOC103468960 [Poecilia reticulata]XP_008414601.1 PREDICTED: uncharacterized protein LOC103468960 [Poecilia reticulata]XP_008414602.1 PREDICTED: uncharacterized protein LOC103468960 [Poecilia reticulata]XP_008414603.1 PREDICTED: uncharacterized protein LOC103468960 [Poecilia reticulata]
MGQVFGMNKYKRVKKTKKVDFMEEYIRQQFRGHDPPENNYGTLVELNMRSIRQKGEVDDKILGKESRSSSAVYFLKDFLIKHDLDFHVEPIVGPCTEREIERIKARKVKLDMGERRQSITIEKHEHKALEKPPSVKSDICTLQKLLVDVQASLDADEKGWVDFEQQMYKTMEEMNTELKQNFDQLKTINRAFESSDDTKKDSGTKSPQEMKPELPPRKLSVGRVKMYCLSPTLLQLTRRMDEVDWVRKEAAIRFRRRNEFIDTTDEFLGIEEKCFYSREHEERKALQERLELEREAVERAKIQRLAHRQSTPDIMVPEGLRKSQSFENIAAKVGGGPPKVGE